MKHIFSVTQINSYIHRIFESDYALKKIYLKGEVSNCKYHSSGHIYFTLKDEKSTLRCVMFSSDRFKGLAFHLEDGQLIEACGNYMSERSNWQERGNCMSAMKDSSRSLPKKVILILKERNFYLLTRKRLELLRRLPERQSKISGVLQEEGIRRYSFTFIRQKCREKEHRQRL